MLDLKDKVAVITGAGAGIGRALAEGLAKRGSRIAAIDLDASRAEETAAIARSLGVEARSYGADVTDLEALQQLAELIDRDLGGVNLIFANAGVLSPGPLDKTAPSDFDWIFAVNVRGTYNSVIAFLPGLKRADAREDLVQVILTGSENSIALPILGKQTAYTASKHAVLGIADGLRRDLAKTNIRVAIFCPGVVQTDIWNSKRARHAHFGGASEAPAEWANILDSGRSAQDTVRTLLEGLDAGDELILTDPRVRSFTEQRIEALRHALDLCDARVTL